MSGEPREYRLASGGRRPLPQSGDERASRFSVGVLELLLVQDVAMTGLAFVVSYWIRNVSSLFSRAIPLTPGIVGEIVLWGTCLWTVFTALSLWVARGCFGVRVEWALGRPPLAWAAGLTCGSVLIAAALAPGVTELIWG